MAETKSIRIKPSDNPSNWTGTTIYVTDSAVIEFDGRPIVRIHGDGTVENLNQQ